MGHTGDLCRDIAEIHDALIWLAQEAGADSSSRSSWPTTSSNANPGASARGW
ncbi:hypothetical protein ACFYO5_37395 [Streptomyces sp. NPDC006259]|uniref:hypothetical protein n=1 Tax=Streptomyces sp. NPDC006259 TaxID=3364740 RepID=UPI00367A7564